MNRRTVLKGGFVLAVTSHTAVATADAVAQGDPLLDAIAAYKRGWQAFMEAPDELSDAMGYLWQEPHDVLRKWTEPARSLKSALAALSVAIEEEDTGDSPVTGPMMRAAYAFLNREVQ